MKDQSQKEINLRDLVRVIFRHKIIIIACLITIMISVYMGLELRTPVYVASVRILVSGTMQKDLEVARSLGPGQIVSTQMLLVTSRPIIKRVVEALKLYQRPLDYEQRYATRFKAVLIKNSVRKLKLDIEKMTPEEKRSFLFNNAMRELYGKIVAFPEGETSIFRITVTDFNAANAGRIANVLSRSYVIFDLEQQIAELQLTYGRKNETIKKLEKHIEKLQETLDGRILPDIEAIGPATVKIIAQAGPGVMRPMKPTKSSGLIAGFVMSMVLGITLAFGFDYFDQTFKSPDEVEKFLNIPCLGSVHKRKKGDNFLIKHTNSVTKYTQSFQNLSNRIYLLMKDKNLKSILLADTEGSRENAAVIANLGVFAAQKNENKVLIIDADLRSSTLSNIFNVASTPGLADILEGGISFENAIQDMGSNLSLLPAGKTGINPVVLLESSTMSDIIKKAKEHYDITYIHCPDLRNFTDGVILSSITDGFVLIVNEGKIKRQIVKHAISHIEQENIKILGVIINNFKYVIPEIIYKLT